MTCSECRSRVLRLAIGHSVHLVILLAPTLLLGEFQQVGWSLVCFACGITVAAVLESHFVTLHFHAENIGVRDRLAMRVAMSVGFSLLTLFWAAQIEYLIRCPSDLIVHVSGGAALAGGIFLRIAAIRALGTQFVNDIRRDGVPVRIGIYRWLRHPSEIGLLLIAGGGPLLIGAPVTATAAVILLSPVSLWRMRREDLVWAN